MAASTPYAVGACPINSAPLAIRLLLEAHAKPIAHLMSA
jgi:hypothetical protein